MADIKWSTLFPKTGGSGRGGAFTGKVLTPALSPYTVVAGDRLVIPQTDQPLVIDPSALKDDEAFQVIDASRHFDKNPVTIKGDKLAIQIVGQGNDLILDMIGAGNLWEFIASGGQLLVADSPGYLGELPTGGGAPAGSITVDATLNNNSTNPIQNKAVADALGSQGRLISGFDAELKGKADLVNGKVKADQLPPTAGAPSFNQRDFAASSQPTLPTITAAPGDLIVVHFKDNDNDVPDASITFPTPNVGDKPIRVLFTGGLARFPQNNQASVMARDAEIVITSPVPIVGAWDDFESGDKSLNLDMPGEMAEFSPFMLDGNPAWLITNANYVSEDSHMKVITSDYNVAMGDSIISFSGSFVHLPLIDLERDLDPITIIYNFRGDIVGQDRGGSLKVIGLLYGDNGAQDTIQGKYKGQKLAVNSESKMGQPTAFEMTDGDWVTLTPYKAPTAGSFWLITGCNPS